MVDFIRDDETKIGPKKYIYNFPLFNEIEDQSNIKSRVSEGWKTDNAPQDATKSGRYKKTFRYYFSIDDKDILTVKNVLIKIINNNQEQVYDLFKNPDNVRISFETAQSIGKDYPKNDDGTPNEKEMPSFYVARFMFDSFPSDSTNYQIEIIGDEDSVILSENGTFSIIDEQ